MPEVLTRVEEDDSIEKFEAGYYRNACGMCGENHKHRSRFERKYRAMQEEHARLQAIVVEAARSLRQVELFPAADWPIERERENFRRDVDALIGFESENKIGEK